MILSLKRKFNYDKRCKGYKLVILHTDPRYDVKAPDNNFIKNEDYLKFMEKCQNEDFKSCEFIIIKGIIYLPVPKEYTNTWELVDILIKRLYKAILHILKENSICDDPLLAYVSIEIFIHEHSV